MSLGTLVPPWFAVMDPTQLGIILSAWFWGFTMCLATYSFTKAVRQTYRSWMRSSRVNAYIVMIWLEWVAGIIVAAASFGYTMNWILPSLWFFVGMLVLWVIQIQCLTQILANRISLILYDNEKARRLKLGVAACIGFINITVFIIWVPARLQISLTWIHINSIWDRCEKCIFLIVDVMLNIYFMRLVKSKLIAEGLDRYKQVYRFNVLLVFISIALDVAVIGLMSLRDDAVYIQGHALTYMAKLNIEMHLAELIGKVVKRASVPQSTPDIEGGWPTTPGREVFHRDFGEKLKRCCRQTGAHLCCYRTSAGSDSGHGEWKKAILCPPRMMPAHLRRGSSMMSVHRIEEPGPLGRADAGESCDANSGSGSTE